MRKRVRGKILLLFGDLLIVFTSIIVAHIIRFGSFFHRDRFVKYFYISILLSIIYVFSFYIFDQYNTRTRFRGYKSLLLYIGSLILVILIAIAGFYMFPFSIGRGIFVLSFIFTSLFSFLWRNAYNSVFRFAFPKRKVLIIGFGEKEKELHDLIKEHEDYEVVGVLDDNNPRINDSFKYLGRLEKLPDILSEYRVDEIVTTLDPTRSDELIGELVKFKTKGVSIYDYPTFFEELRNKIPVFRIKEKELFYSNGFERLGNKLYKRVKRILDLLVSSSIFLITLPLTLIIMILIKLDSKGPIFYIQERFGENEKMFRLIKFRSMIKDAEKEGPKWAKKKDSRITRVGKILRKTRFDELPQLINIIKGDMSLIGPRPEREYFIDMLKKKVPFYSMRFSVKPGLTGWAQVNYRYGSSVEDAVEKLSYDLYYIKHTSFFLDFMIIIRTLRTMLFGKGR